MKKNNKKNNNNLKTIIVAVIAVVLIAALVAGGTYAWWSWTSNVTNNSENTAVEWIIDTPTFTVISTNVAGKTVAPSSVCYGEGYTLTGRTTVTAKNATSVTMKTSFVLSAKLTPVSGRTLSTDAKSHLHWAIKEVAAANTAFAVGNCNSTTNSATFATGTFSTVGTSATNLTTTITFDVNPDSTATKYYQLYVWLDSGYSYKNVGSNAVQDPMQDATILLTYNNTLTKFEQVQS